MATYDIGGMFVPRARQLENPMLADKMLSRSISRVELEAVLADNEVIEVYEHDDRVRYVLLGRAGGRPLHIVVAEDDVVDATVVLSVYEPGLAHGWDPATGYRTRREGDLGGR